MPAMRQRDYHRKCRWCGAEKLIRQNKVEARTPWLCRTCRLQTECAHCGGSFPTPGDAATFKEARIWRDQHFTRNDCGQIPQLPKGTRHA